MKENYDDIYDSEYIDLKTGDIKDIFNVDIKSTSNESGNNKDYIIDDKIDLKYDNYDNFFDEIGQKKYKYFQKIVCSECGEIPFIY